jgi:SCP-2 sterol transfer family
MGASAETRAEGTPVSDPIEEFFEGLARRDAQRLPRRANGSLRIDLEDGKATQRWFVTIDDGEVSVSHRNAKADFVIRTSKEVFEGMVGGTVNPMAATLRGGLSLEGDPAILVLFQRVFPGPPPERARVAAHRSGS